nr:glycosyltransferase family 2 protein [uncultured Marinifilum sp.]
MERKCTAVIILNYNNSGDTINCIDSVHKYNKAPIKFIVIDNGSIDKNVIGDIEAHLALNFQNKHIVLNEESEEIKCLPYITFYRLKENLGYACGNNKGLKLIENDKQIENVLILNNDILFTEDIISSLNNDINSLPQIAIVSPLLKKRDNQTIDNNCARRSESKKYVLLQHIFCFQDLFGFLSKLKKKQYMLNADILKNRKTIEIDLPSGSCMLIKKKLFENIGFFDPNTFLYYEENIINAKIKKIGLKNYLNTSISCIHLGASTTKKEKTNIFLIKCGIQSKNYYLKTFTNAGVFFLNMLYFFEYVSLLALRIKNSIKDK